MKSLAWHCRLIHGSAMPHISRMNIILDPPTDSVRLPLLVAIHGTSRRNLRYIATWKQFALEHECAIVAPLFPGMLQGPTDLDGYHYLDRPKPKPASPFFDKIVQKEVAVPKVYASINAEGYTNLRYDLILLAMLDEVSLLLPAIDTS